MYIKYMMWVFFVPMRLFGEKAAWVYQAHNTVQLNLFYMMIGLTHHEKQTSCTWSRWCKILTAIPPLSYFLRCESLRHNVQVGISLCIYVIKICNMLIHFKFPTLYIFCPKAFSLSIVHWVETECPYLFGLHHKTSLVINVFALLNIWTGEQ